MDYYRLWQPATHYVRPLLPVSNDKMPCQLSLKYKALTLLPCIRLCHYAAVTSFLWQPCRVDKNISDRSVIQPAGRIFAMPLLSLRVKYNCVCIGAMGSLEHKVPAVDEILPRRGRHRHSSQLGFCIFFSVIWAKMSSQPDTQKPCTQKSFFYENRDNNVTNSDLWIWS